MGRVIIKFEDDHLESFRCKSEIRASEIVRKRPTAKKWNYYGDNDTVPQPTKRLIKDLKSAKYFN